MAHRQTNSERQSALSESDEWQLINESTQIIAQQEGSRRDSIWLTTAGEISDFCYGLPEGTLA
ncbi:MAG: hypothetical protein ACFCU9_08335 [Cyanophyceae cyanobacterium]